jgi:hypothetical protein
VAHQLALDLGMSVPHHQAELRDDSLAQVVRALDRADPARVQSRAALTFDHR